VGAGAVVGAKAVGFAGAAAGATVVVGAGVGVAVVVGGSVAGSAKAVVAVPKTSPPATATPAMPLSTGRQPAIFPVIDFLHTRS
jgi:hypothetical protein